MLNLWRKENTAKYLIKNCYASPKQLSVYIIAILLLLSLFCSFSLIQNTKADDTNKASPFTVPTWRYGSIPNYYNDASVYHSVGNSSIRLERHTAADDNPGREIDSPFIVCTSGDNISASVWIKTQASGNPSGARLGIDLYGLNEDGIAEGWSWLPVYYSGSWVPWGSDWTQQYFNATIPDDIYGMIDPDTGLPYTEHSLEIWGVKVWVSAWPTTDIAYAWFADAEIYINPDDGGGSSPPASGSETLLISQATSDAADYETIVEGGGFHKEAGQTFTVGATDVTLTKVALNITTIGSARDLIVDIKATAAGVPTGSVLSTGTISAASISNKAFNNCTMSEVTLSAGTQYAIIARSPTADGSNFLEWYDRTTNPYAGGTIITSTDSGSTWSIDSGSDFAFKVYGIEVTEDSYTLSLTVNTPANTTYTSGTLSYDLQTSGNDTVSGYQINIYQAGSPIGLNVTVGPAGSFSGLSNGTYKFAAYVSGLYGSYDYEEVVFTIAIPPSPTPTPSLPTVESDAWYFTSTVYTYNVSFSSYTISMTNSDTNTNITTSTSASTVSYGFRVWLLRASGSLTELTDGTPEALVTRTETGSGYQSGYWTPESTDLVVGYDHLLVGVYMQEDEGDWNAKSTFLSSGLLYKQIYPTTWNFTVYTEVTDENAVLAYGDSTFTSRVSGVSFKEALPQEIALYYGQSGDFINMILYPYVYIIGNLAYSIAFILVGGSFYLKNRKIEILVVLAVLFCGSQGIAAIIPDVAFRIIYVVILLVITVMLYRLFR